nr:MAG TPA: hypothetical protein [Caudoviricetes sp.]
MPTARSADVPRGYSTVSRLFRTETYICAYAREEK